MRLASLAAAAFGAVASAQIVSFEADSGIQYAVSIPQQTSDSGSGPIYFQLSGPTSFAWIAMGFGGPIMQGTHIFVMYADGKGNVTISPRNGLGFFEPQFDPNAKFEILEGSGIRDGMMVANVRCDNCETWQDTYKLQFGSTQQMIYAHRLGPQALDTTDEKVNLVQHDHNGKPFSFDLSKAVTQSTTNPFLNNSPADGGAVASGGSSASSSSDGNGMFMKAHGTIMALSMVVLFPSGGLLMRLFSFKALWAVHASLQVFTLTLLTAGFGIGYWLAGQLGIRYKGMGRTHTTLGTCVFAFFWFQPVVGLFAHWMFTKRRTRTIAGLVHAWFGRIIILLGIVNGGLGLKLADNTMGGKIAYGVIAGIVGVSYITIVSTVEIKKVTRSASKDSLSEKGAALQSSRGNDVESPHASDLEGYRSSDSEPTKTNILADGQ